MWYIIQPIDMKYTREIMPNGKLDAIPFWGGFMSNWHPSPFIIDGINYNCVEQHMMFNKAKYFGDIESAKKVLAADSPREQKKLGRKVSGFDAVQWRAVCYDICIEGVYHKFLQNEELKLKLIATGDSILIEGSPYDKIWGIGVDWEDDDCYYVERWNGDNLLGFMLMEVRDWIN